jgi:hypothetical protein
VARKEPSGASGDIVVDKAVEHDIAYAYYGDTRARANSPTISPLSAFLGADFEIRWVNEL